MIISISGYIGSGKDIAGNIIRWLQLKQTYNVWSKEAFIKGEVPEVYFKQNGCDWQIKKWAGPLRKVAAILLGMDEQFLYTDEFKQMILPEQWNYNSICQKTSEGHARMTGREFLQKLGTDAIRNGLHENAWVNALLAEYDVKCPTPQWCDCSAGFDYKDEIDESRVENYASDFCKKKGYPNWLITDTRFPNELAAVKERGGISIRINRNSVQWPEKLAPLHASETSLDTAEFDYIIDNNGTIEELTNKLKAILIERELIK